METTNNFEIIKNLLTFKTSNDFYFIQILKRRKDKGNEDMPTGVKVIKDLYIYNQDELELNKDYIIKLCQENNARAMIRLNVRNLEHCALHSIQKIMDLIINKDLKLFEPLEDDVIKFDSQVNALRQVSIIALAITNKDYFGAKSLTNKIIYSSVCGSHSAAGKGKTWIVDIDTKDVATIVSISDYIKWLQQEIKGNDYKIIGLIPSRSGFHIISNPFNLDKFKKQFPNIDVHKDAPTNLFIP